MGWDWMRWRYCGSWGIGSDQAALVVRRNAFMREHHLRMLGLYIVVGIVLGVAAAALGADVFRQVLGGAMLGILIGVVGFLFYRYKVEDKVEWVLGSFALLLLVVVGWSASVKPSATDLAGEGEIPEPSTLEEQDLPVLKELSSSNNTLSEPRFRPMVLPDFIGKPPDDGLTCEETRKRLRGQNSRQIQSSGLSYLRSCRSMETGLCAFGVPGGDGYCWASSLWGKSISDIEFPHH